MIVREDTGEYSPEALLELCRSDPDAGLHVLAAMSRDQEDKDSYIFARLTALRERIARSISGEIANLFDVSDIDLKKRMSDQTFQYVEEAFEAAEPVLRKQSADTLASAADDIAAYQERLNRGTVQPRLGWIKLKYLGKSRVGTTCHEEVPPVAIANFLDAQVRSPHPIVSAILKSAHRRDDGTWEGTYLLMKTDFATEDAVGIGSVVIGEDACIKFTSSSALSDAIHKKDETSLFPTPPQVPVSTDDMRSDRSKAILLASGCVVAVLLIVVTLFYLPSDMWPAFLRSNSSAVSASPAAPSTPAAGNASGTVYATRLTHIRNGPTSIGTMVIGNVQGGQAISGTWVLGRDGTTLWLQITQSDGSSGFIWGRNISTSPPPSTEQR